MNIVDPLLQIFDKPLNEAAFKRAVKQLASQVEKETGLPLQRIYREIAYQAFLNRIARSGLRFILKGGFSLELQSDKPTRVTTDIDMIYIEEAASGEVEPRDVIVSAVKAALADNSGDFFRFKFEEERGPSRALPRAVSVYR